MAELSACPRCSDGGGGVLYRLRIRDCAGIYLTCDECDALWASDDFRPDDYSHGLHDFDTFLAEHDRSYPEDTFWLDTLFRLFEVVRLTRDIPEHDLSRGAHGTVVDLLDGDGRAYEVEFTDSQGRTTFVGPLGALSLACLSPRGLRRES